VATRYFHFRGDGTLLHQRLAHPVTVSARTLGRLTRLLGEPPGFFRVPPSFFSRLASHLRVGSRGFGRLAESLRVDATTLCDIAVHFIRDHLIASRLAPCFGHFARFFFDCTVLLRLYALSLRLAFGVSAGSVVRARHEISRASVDVRVKPTIVCGHGR
jgi:hypothetical protein